MALPRVTVVGLGPGSPELVGAGVRERMAAAPARYLRTTRHPSAAVVGDAVSLDRVYEGASSLDEVYPAIVEELVAAATAHGEVAYAVPGSPLVAERTVELLRADERVEVDVVPALSFVDLAWERLGVDPFAVGARLVDGHRFAVAAAGSTGPLLVSQCDSTLVLSDIKLAVEDGPDVVLLSRLGLPSETVTHVPWADLDRTVAPDHLTCLWIPGLAAPVAAEVVRFEELVTTLRERCPWDREQTHASLTPYLVEEAYEALEAIEAVAAIPAVDEDADVEGLAYEHLEEELGDLLFQIVFHATLAREAGRFTLADVARGIHDKLVGRHPHVFAADGGPAGRGADLEAVRGTWEQLKAAEKGRTSALDGLPPALPALQAAAKLGRRAAGVGFDWPEVEGVWAKVHEELAELRGALDQPGSDDETTLELGDVLFSLANLGRHLGIDPEAALRAANAKFRRRFTAVEAMALEAGGPPGVAGLDAPALELLWQRVKVAERSADGKASPSGGAHPPRP